MEIQGNPKAWSTMKNTTVAPWNESQGGLSPVGNAHRHRHLWKYVPHLNYRICKVDISKRQGHSGRTCVKPPLFHYTIRTWDVKRRSHADNIIGFLYGRSKSMIRCTPWERWGHWQKSSKKKNSGDVHTCIHLWQVQVLASIYCVYHKEEARVN